jgi:hypothetical protein
MQNQWERPGPNTAHAPLHRRARAHVVQSRITRARACLAQFAWPSRPCGVGQGKVKTTTANKKLHRFDRQKSARNAHEPPFVRRSEVMRTRLRCGRTVRATRQDKIRGADMRCEPPTVLEHMGGTHKKRSGDKAGDCCCARQHAALSSAVTRAPSAAHWRAKTRCRHEQRRRCRRRRGGR